MTFPSQQTTGRGEGVIPIPRSVHRLAAQLSREPAALATEILMAGICALDDGLAGGGGVEAMDLGPLIFVAIDAGYDMHPQFTVTGRIEAMDDETLANCQKEADDCGLSLQEIIRERCTMGVNLRSLIQRTALAEIGGAA